MVWAAVAVLGLVVGSFLNVCIYRLPREESVVFPGSRCPGCGRKLAWYDLVPVWSYLWLRGCCRHCHMRISPRYPVVEAATSLAFLLLYHRLGSGGDFVTSAWFLSVLIVATGIDLEHQIIPNELVLAGLIGGVVLTAVFAPAAWGQRVVGALAGHLSLLLVYVLSRGGMGMGDVKLAAVLGFFLGWPLVLLAIFSGFVLGALAGTWLLATRRKGRKDTLPFGPFLAVGAVVALGWGAELWAWYLRQFPLP
ncbi:MAG: prepilin peptidase [Bacillota bacterium]